MVDLIRQYEEQINSAKQLDEVYRKQRFELHNTTNLDKSMNIIRLQARFVSMINCLVENSFL